MSGPFSSALTGPVAVVNEVGPSLMSMDGIWETANSIQETGPVTLVAEVRPSLLSVTGVWKAVYLSRTATFTDTGAGPETGPVAL